MSGLGGCPFEKRPAEMALARLPWSASSEINHVSYNLRRAGREGQAQ